MSKSKVLLIEDEEILMQSLRDFLTRTGYDVKCVSDESSAIECLKEEPYNVVVTDLLLCEGSGFGIMKYLQGCDQETKCIVITGHASLDSAIRALRRGAFDYILKPFEYHELQAAIENAIRRQMEQTQIKKVDYKAMERTYGLTNKEVEVVSIVISEGLSNDDIAGRLNISRNTVKVHLRNIFKKVGVESKTALASKFLSGSVK